MFVDIYKKNSSKAPVDILNKSSRTVQLASKKMKIPRLFSRPIAVIWTRVVRKCFDLHWAHLQICAVAQLFYRVLRTKKRCSFSRDLLALSVRVFGDKLPKQVEVVYAFSQTKDNEDGMCDAVKILSEQYPKAVILMSGEDGSRGCGWEGFARFKQCLENAGVSAQRMEGVPFPESEANINTLNESRALLNFCSRREISDIIIVAPPFHLLRCSITFVSCLVSESRRRPLVYSSAALSMSWIETVAHSQGRLRGSRSSFIYSEISRIWRYYVKGDLEHPRDVFNWLDGQAKDAGR